MSTPENPAAAPAPADPVGGDSIEVVCVTNGDPEKLLRCLTSLREAVPPGVVLDFGVVDNATTDETSLVLEELGDELTSLRLDSPQPLTAAFHRGLRRPTGLALFVTPDVVFEPGFLPPLLERFDEMGSTEAVSPTVVRTVAGTQQAGVSTGLEGPSGVCLMVNVGSDGNNIAHAENSVVSSLD